ncbi:MAG: hypothetical protein JJO71_10280 [Escherichia coli]|nr:hypothetical protein [Escherichia coli]
METTNILTTSRAAVSAAPVTRFGALCRCAASLRRWLQAEHVFLPLTGTRCG